MSYLQQVNSLRQFYKTGQTKPYFFRKEQLLKLKNAIIDGTVARPSNPSVRLTAFDAATITIIQNKIENIPISNNGNL